MHMQGCSCCLHIHAGLHNQPSLARCPPASSAKSAQNCWCLTVVCCDNKQKQKAKSPLKVLPTNFSIRLSCLRLPAPDQVLPVSLRRHTIVYQSHVIFQAGRLEGSRDILHNGLYRMSKRHRTKSRGLKQDILLVVCSPTVVACLEWEVLTCASEEAASATKPSAWGGVGPGTNRASMMAVRLWTCMLTGEMLNRIRFFVCVVMAHSATWKQCELCERSYRSSVHIVEFGLPVRMYTHTYDPVFT